MELVVFAGLKCNVWQPGTPNSTTAFLGEGEECYGGSAGDAPVSVTADLQQIWCLFKH